MGGRCRCWSRGRCRLRHRSGYSGGCGCGICRSRGGGAGSGIDGFLQILQSAQRAVGGGLLAGKFLSRSLLRDGLLGGRLVGARGRFGQRQLVLCGGLWLAIGDLGLHLTGHLTRAFCCWRRGCNAGQAPTEGVEVLALCHDHATGFSGIHTLSFAGRRHLDDGTRFQSVDVALNEGVWVGFEHGHQHLVERYASGTQSGGDGASRVATGHSHRAWGRCGGGRWRNCRRGRWGGGHRCGLLNRLSHRWSGSCHCRGRGRGCRGGRRSRLGRSGHRVDSLDLGWVQQEGVFALQLARGPLGLHHQLHKGLRDWAFAADIQVFAPIGALFDADSQAIECGIELNAQTGVGVR